MSKPIHKVSIQIQKPTRTWKKTEEMRLEKSQNDYLGAER